MKTSRKIIHNIPTLPFEEAKKLIHKLKITSNKKYKKLHKQRLLPPGLPANPFTAYPDKKWSNLSFPNRYANKSEIQKFIDKFKLISLNQYHEYRKQFKGILAESEKEIVFFPSIIKSYNFNFHSPWPAYEISKKLILENHIKTRKEYYKKCQKLELPTKPMDVYKKEWKSWYNYLNKENRPNKIRGYRKFCSFETVINIMKLENIGIGRYIQIRKKLMKKYKEQLPSNPQKVYPQWKQLKDK